MYNFISRMKLATIFKILTSLICMCVAYPMLAGEPISSYEYNNPNDVRGVKASYWPYYYSGARYFLVSGATPFESPELGNFKKLGFIVNPDDEKTYITPDGEIVPSFHQARAVVCWCEQNWYNGCVYYASHKCYTSFVGDIYIPDKMLQALGLENLVYVLEVWNQSLGEDVTSVRTPLYARIYKNMFEYAVNMKRVQIGACYVVETSAFPNCNALETVIFEKAPYVQKEAFPQCTRIRSVVLCSEENLPMLEDASVFDDTVYKNATLYLPDSMIGKYKEDPVWSKFTHTKSVSEFISFMVDN